VSPSKYFTSFSQKNHLISFQARNEDPFSTSTSYLIK